MSGLTSGLTTGRAPATIPRFPPHEVRNVLERQRDSRLAARAEVLIVAAYRLEVTESVAKLRQRAAWLKRERKDAAASLIER